MKVKIIADSTCDLSEEVAALYGIEIIPLPVMKEGKEYRDQVTIHPEDMFAYTEQTGILCTTSAVSVAEYEMIYSRVLATCDEVVHFTVSSALSSCWQNATLAAQGKKQIHVLDSQSICTGMGIQVVYAAMLAEEGLSAQQIVEKVLARQKQVRIQFLLSTLEYMAKGGRCSSVLALGANLLRIKPCLYLEGGTIHIGKRYRGSLEKALDAAITDWLREPETIDTRIAFVSSSASNPALEEMTERRLRAALPFEKIYHTRIGCIIGGHCGPECIGAVFYRK